ncbi:MAG TPA: nucleotidyl transferase AbiEii/AbiGii toxin family protein [Mycobacteriales bacterium]|nr:nucleotidyl transferase AbiEii/AbiGii toxin family protein [Mycobacteriales bacterium]
MSQSSQHPARVSPEFQASYPTPAALLWYVKTEVPSEFRDDFITDRVLARLGPDILIGGSRAAGLPAQVQNIRGMGDLDVGISVEAEELLTLKPKNRIPAIDRLVRSRLAADLGDHVELNLQLSDQNERGTFYQIRGRIAGLGVGRMSLDVDCDPHVTAPVIHSFFPLCEVEIPGLEPGMRTYQNPADVFAEKILALKRCETFGDKPRYAKHLCDLHQMLALRLLIRIWLSSRLLSFHIHLEFL